MGLVQWDRAGGSSGDFSVPQLLQAQNNQFNPHVHVEYEWWLGQDDMYESDDELDEKVRTLHGRMVLAYHHWSFSHHAGVGAPVLADHSCWIL